MIEAYEVAINTDTTEGRGPMRTLGYFKRESDANMAAKNSNNYDMGGNLLASVTQIQVFETYSEYEAHKNSKLRQSALAKLTPDERKVLGL